MSIEMNETSHLRGAKAHLGGEISGFIERPMSIKYPSGVLRRGINKSTNLYLTIFLILVPGM